MGDVHVGNEKSQGGEGGGYLVIAVIYFVLCFAFNRLFLIGERHLKDTDDYALAVEYLEND